MARVRTPTAAAVIGGGIQGCATALELARRGVRVHLFERDAGVFQGASLHNEGKVHLGFVYAADPTLRSATLMARGAAVFGSALGRWLGDRATTLSRSQPFHYAVHEESLRSPADLAATYADIGEVLRAEVGPEAYFGSPDPSRVRLLEPGELGGFGPVVSAVFETEEIAVDTLALGRALGDALAQHALVTVETSAKVVKIDAQRARLTIDGAAGRRMVGGFDHVVNCAWDGRVSLDAQVGIRPVAPWCFRMKYFARVPRSADTSAPPVTTVVLGPFGDVVDVGGETYMTWYPAVRRGWSLALEPPSWPSELPERDAESMLADIAAGLEPIVPSASRLLRGHARGRDVRGGVIYALGETDVGDRASGLHERHQVGPISVGTYHTVDTGKLSLAPMFAMQVADRIRAHARV